MSSKLFWSQQESTETLPIFDEASRLANHQKRIKIDKKSINKKVIYMQTHHSEYLKLNQIAQLVNFKLLALLLLSMLFVVLILAVAPKKHFLMPKRLLSSNLLEENPINVNIPADSVPRWYFNQLNTPFSKQTKPNDVQKQAAAMQKSVPLKIDEPIKQKYTPNPQFAYEVIAGITAQQQIFGGRLIDLYAQSSQQIQYLSQYQKQYYEQKYQISSFKQLPICAIVPTYNNYEGKRYLSNIHSIIQQSYSNYKIVVIDDLSPDHTGIKIQQELQKIQFDKDKYRIVTNQARLYALGSIRKAAKDFCSTDDILIIIDGDDQLLGKQVFKLFNQVFQQKNAWFVYSNFIDIRTKNIGFSRPFESPVIEHNLYRQSPFYTSHLRAFYNKLFLKIEEKDLLDQNGQYFQAANDVAICMPILEMSHKHVYYLREVTYGYNANTGNNNHQIRANDQRVNDKKVRSRAAYKALENL